MDIFPLKSMVIFFFMEKYEFLIGIAIEAA